MWTISLSWVLVENVEKLWVLVKLGNLGLFTHRIPGIKCGSMPLSISILQPRLKLSWCVQDSLLHFCPQEPTVANNCWWLTPGMAVSCQFSTAWRERFPFSQRAMNEECSLLGRKRKTSKAWGQGHGIPFLTPAIDSRYLVMARWHEERSEKALCLQTYCHKCHRYNWKASLAINENKSLAPAIKKNRHPGMEEVKGKTQ